MSSCYCTDSQVNLFPILFYIIIVTELWGFFQLIFCMKVNIIFELTSKNRRVWNQQVVFLFSLCVPGINKGIK